MAPSLTLRPSLQRRYSCTRRRNKVRARHRWGRSPLQSQVHACLASPPGLRRLTAKYVPARTLITLKHTPRHLSTHTFHPGSRAHSKAHTYYQGIASVKTVMLDGMDTGMKDTMAASILIRYTRRNTSTVYKSRRYGIPSIAENPAHRLVWGAVGLYRYQLNGIKALGIRA